jgi:hypothetical protein
MGIRSTNLTVDLKTPDIPNAMDRIRKKNTDKKKAATQKKKNMAEFLEVAREEVLESYKIKSIL